MVACDRGIIRFLRFFLDLVELVTGQEGAKEAKKAKEPSGGELLLKTVLARKISSP